MAYDLHGVESACRSCISDQHYAEYKWRVWDNDWLVGIALAAAVHRSPAQLLSCLVGDKHSTLCMVHACMTVNATQSTHLCSLPDH